MAGSRQAIQPVGGVGATSGAGRGAAPAFASGSDSAALTTGVGSVEATLLLGALSLVALTGRSRAVRGAMPAGG